MNQKSITSETLMKEILKRLEHDTTYAEDIKPILDYGQPTSSSQDVIIDSWHFDFEPIVSYGGNEGIYTDLYISGKIPSTAEEFGRHRIGCFKTLDADYAAMLEMGKLCGLLVYHGSNVIIELF